MEQLFLSVYCNTVRSEQMLTDDMFPARSKSGQMKPFRRLDDDMISWKFEFRPATDKWDKGKVV